MSHSVSKSMHKPRQTMPIAAGNGLQIAGIGLGCVLLWFSANPISALSTTRTVAMTAGYILIYFATHSLSHYGVGRVVGITFTHYSVGGSMHAASYPPILRQFFAHMPFFAAHTDARSLQSAPPRAQAVMFGAGIVGTILFCSLAALFVFLAHVSGAAILFGFNAVWQVSALITELRIGGDLAKAAKALRLRDR
jgi:hypothetical protein